MATDLIFSYPPIHMAGCEDKTWEFMREPVLRVMPDGSYMCLHYSGGKKEPAQDNLILLTRSTDKGLTWTKPVVAFRHATRPCWGTELFTGFDRPCAFVNTFVVDTHYRELRSHITWWDNETETWSFPVSVPGVNNTSVRMGITASNGTAIFPVYWQESGGDAGHWQTDMKPFSPIDRSGHYCCGAMISRDDGKSFSLHGYIHLPDKSLWEPTIVETTPGHLIMLMRHGDMESVVLYRSESDDFGLTWSDPVATDIPNPASKVTLLKNNEDVLLFHSPTSGGVAERRKLELWISRDNMKSWAKKLPLAFSPKDTMLCYPHADYDAETETFIVALDSKYDHWLQKIQVDELV